LLFPARTRRAFFPAALPVSIGHCTLLGEIKV
jgi:hypothetical protein